MEDAPLEANLTHSPATVNNSSHIFFNAILMWYERTPMEHIKFFNENCGIIYEFSTLEDDYVVR